MGEIMQQITEWLIHISNQPWVLAVVYAFCAIDGFFPPIPSESIVVTLASLSVSSGSPAIWALFLAAFLGAATGDSVAFWLGHLLRPSPTHGPKILRGPRFLAALDWARRGLSQRTALMLMVGRQIPGGRVAVNLTAGATGMSYTKRFLPISLLACFVWALWGVLIGTLAGHWFEGNPLLGVVIAIALSVVLGLLIDAIVQRVLKARGIDPVSGEKAASAPVAESSVPDSAPVPDPVDSADQR